MVNTIRRLCGYKFPRLGSSASNLFFSLAPSVIQCELFPDIKVKLNLTDLTQRATFWQGARFEYPTSRILKSWNGTLFFDIGANYGFYSLFMLTTFPDIQAYAFEPNPLTYDRILQIKKDNNLELLQVFNIGVGSQTGEANLHPGIDDSGNSTFLEHPEFLDSSVGKVEIKTFEQWRCEQRLEMPRRPEWVAKIDVEGMELNVLQGMTEVLQAKAFKGLVVEVLEHTLALAGHKPEDIYSFMSSVGYKPLDNKNLLHRYGRINTDNVFFEPIEK